MGYCWLFAEQLHPIGNAAKGDGGMAYEHLVERDGLGTCEVREAKADLTAVKAHTDRISKGDILCIYRFFTIGN